MSEREMESPFNPLIRLRSATEWAMRNDENPRVTYRDLLAILDRAIDEPATDDE